MRLRGQPLRATVRLLKQLLDPNEDGSVSPSELTDFLRYFGPLKCSIQRVRRSLLEPGTTPPRMVRA